MFSGCFQGVFRVFFPMPFPGIPFGPMGFLASRHGQLGAIPPPPCLSISPLESMRSGGAIAPLKRGISAILARYPIKPRGYLAKITHLIGAKQVLESYDLGGFEDLAL